MTALTFRANRPIAESAVELAARSASAPLLFSAVPRHSSYGAMNRAWRMSSPVMSSRTMWFHNES